MSASLASLSQYGTISAMLAGNYGSKVTVGQALQDGCDLGVGAGPQLGEVIALDGCYYQADPYGKMHQLSAADSLSFLTATQFVGSWDVFSLKQGIAFSELEKFILDKIGNDQLSCAIKIVGMAPNILLRSQNYVPLLGAPLVQWLKENENQYALQNAQGAWVIFYSPNYTQGFGVPGMHAHFITADKMIGGHVIDGEIGAGSKISIQIMHDIQLYPVNTQYASL